MIVDIKKCVTTAEIASTFDVMQQLRPTIKREKYVELVASLMETENYQLVGAYQSDGKCVGAAGIRFRRSLFREGNAELYVDDLVSDAQVRSQGIGHQMMNWLKEECQRKKDCVGVVLDSGLAREDAHRFYEKEDMKKTALHFYWPNL